jgi:hypothetical protein
MLEFVRGATGMLRNRIDFFRPASREAAIMILVILTGGILNSVVSAQTTLIVPKPVVSGGGPTRYLPNRLSQHALAYYGAVWGIDAISVKAVESGELIRFSYQVLDPQKAKMLNDKTTSAFLVAPAMGIRLSIPTLEKVGQLRQSSTPEAGKSYWMAFSNPGRRVKPGTRVDVVIGNFRAEALVVE